MSQSLDLRCFLDVLSHQVLAIRNYLRHFKKGLLSEFLPDETEVQKDWEINAYSLVFLPGPASQFMKFARCGASTSLLDQIELNMSRLGVVHRDLSDAYTTYCRFTENSPQTSVFSQARPWLIADIENAIHRCTGWLDRIRGEQSFHNVQNEPPNNFPPHQSLQIWKNLSAHDAPASLSDLTAQLNGLNALTDRMITDPPFLNVLASYSLNENPLLQMCMASRRLMIRVLFLLLVDRPQVSQLILKQAQNAMQRALDAISTITHSPAHQLTGKTAEGIRLHTERLDILRILAEPLGSGLDENPAVHLLLSEQKADQILAPTDNTRLLLAMEKTAVA
jgi:hypothetical protein